MSCTVAAWSCMSLTSPILPYLCKKCSFVCSFPQPYVHDIEYNKVLKFLQFFQVERGESMWSSCFIVVVDVQFGVLLAVPRNEARNKPEKPCKLFGTDMCFRCPQKKLLIKRMDGLIFLRWCVPYYTLPLYGWINIYSHRSPWRKIQKWTHAIEILPWRISYVNLGLTTFMWVHVITNKHVVTSSWSCRSRYCIQFHQVEYTHLHDL